MKKKEKMKTVCFEVDSAMRDVIDELRVSFHKTSNAEVFRMGIALLKIASEAKGMGMEMAIAKDDKIKKTIVLS